MNYLFHIYLSGDNNQIKIGNFIADAVKGNQYMQYPEDIKKGILLHRAIDSFSDSHPAVKEAINLARSDFGRYASVLVDMWFDYFLASNYRKLTGRSLTWFALQFYFSLIINYRYLPPRIKRFMWHFILSNRLSKYKSQKGITRSLEIMVKYRQLPIDYRAARQFLFKNESDLKKQFEIFYPDVINQGNRTKISC